jgi:hypothetical protein
LNGTIVNNLFPPGNCIALFSRCVEERLILDIRTRWPASSTPEYGPDHHEDGPWLFKDAPRELRLAASDKIPEVIEALAKTASDTTKQVQEKTKQVRELAAALDQVANANLPANLLRSAQSVLAAAGKQGATAKLSDMAVSTKGSKRHAQPRSDGSTGRHSSPSYDRRGEDYPSRVQ